MRTGEPDTSKPSMRRTPLSPRTSPPQNASRPMPRGVTHPSPVMTTRRGCLKFFNMVSRPRLKGRGRNYLGRNVGYHDAPKVAVALCPTEHYGVSPDFLRPRASHSPAHASAVAPPV